MATSEPTVTRDASDELRHRHVRRAYLASTWFLGLLALLGMPWALGRYAFCWGQAYEQYELSCEYSFLAPLVVIGIMVGVFVWMYESVRRYGIDLEKSERLRIESRAFFRFHHHIAGGYRNLGYRHRSDVRFTLVFGAAMLGAVLAFLLFWLALPTPLVILVLVALPIAMMIVNSWL